MTAYKLKVQTPWLPSQIGLPWTISVSRGLQSTKKNGSKADIYYLCFSVAVATTAFLQRWVLHLSRSNLKRVEVQQISYIKYKFWKLEGSTFCFFLFVFFFFSFFVCFFRLQSSCKTTKIKVSYIMSKFTISSSSRRHISNTNIMLKPKNVCFAIIEISVSQSSRPVWSL